MEKSKRSRTRRLATLGCLALGGAAIAGSLTVLAQPPRGRTHTVTKSPGKLNLVPATEAAPGENQVKIEVDGEQRVIRANGIPDHKTGSFPNSGNPNRITEQRYIYRVAMKPVAQENSTPLEGVFGVAINGIPFDPGAAEYFQGQQGTQWRYEPLSGAIRLGIDVSHAHVQPNGSYHYHGLPSELLSSIELDPKKHSPLVGWAADGFPIYAVYGFSDPNNSESSIKTLKSSFVLKAGERPGGDEPSGNYDGTFVGDYEFKDGTGDLDDCNGRMCVTPEFPEGTYAYFLTENWPVIPRAFRAEPSEDFLKRGPGGPGGFRGPGRGPGGFFPGGFGPPPGGGRPGEGGPGGREPGERGPGGRGPRE